MDLHPFRLPETFRESSGNDSQERYDKLYELSNIMHDILEGITKKKILLSNNDCLKRKIQVMGLTKDNRYLKRLVEYCRNVLKGDSSLPARIDTSEQYLLVPNNSSYIKYNESHSKDEVKTVCNYDGELLKDLVQLSIGEKIRNFMGSNFKIIDARLFETNVDINCGKNVNNKPHVDGGHRITAKVIVYLSDVEVDNGPFCYVENNIIKPICGNAGTVILFRNTQLMHCSLPIKKDNRKVVIFEIIPSLQNNNGSIESKPINAVQMLNPLDLLR